MGGHSKNETPVRRIPKDSGSLLHEQRKASANCCLYSNKNGCPPSRTVAQNTWREGVDVRGTRSALGILPGETTLACRRPLRVSGAGDAQAIQKVFEGGGRFSGD